VEYSRIEGEYTALRGQLTYADRRLAEAALKTGRAKLQKMKQSYEAAQKQHETAERALHAHRAVLTERLSREETDLQQLAELQAQWSAALQRCGFSDENAYRAALLTEADVTKLEQAIAAYDQAGALLERDVSRLAAETEGKVYQDLSGLRQEQEALDAQLADANERLAILRSRRDRNRLTHQHLCAASVSMAAAETYYASCKALSDTANGELGGKVKITFEAFVQRTYFARILYAANQRFAAMSGGQYELQRSRETDNLRSQTGLELEVLDHHTGKLRDVRSLSGGESFKASLSLALGLSDVVQQVSGGVRLDTMFIDEGFGSLDFESLENAISVLQTLAGAHRTIGIISHVEALHGRIDQQIVVHRGKQGSWAEVIA
jgi:exonuclease SbcC